MDAQSGDERVLTVAASAGIEDDLEIRRDVQPRGYLHVVMKFERGFAAWFLADQIDKMTDDPLGHAESDRIVRRRDRHRGSIRAVWRVDLALGFVAAN